MTTVSVIIPTRNRPELVKQAIDSVLAQSFTDYELIINDNSTNLLTSKLIKNDYFDKRIKYKKCETDLSMVENWNSAVLRAKSEFCTLLMDDDLWDVHFLKKTVSVMKKNQKIGLVACEVVPFRSDNKKSGYPKDYYRLNHCDMTYVGTDCIRSYLKDKWLVGLPSAILVRTACFREFGLFDIDGLDQEMWLRICHKYDFYYLDNKLCKWRIDSDKSYTSTLTVKDSLYRRLRTVEKIIGYPFTEAEVGEFKYLASKASLKLRSELLQLCLKDPSVFSSYKLFANGCNLINDVNRIIYQKVVSNISNAYDRLTK